MIAVNIPRRDRRLTHPSLFSKSSESLASSLDLGWGTGATAVWHIRMYHDFCIPNGVLSPQQEVLSELGDILAAEEARLTATAATADARRGSEVSVGALTAAVHLLQWDHQVVSSRGIAFSS